MVLPEPSFWRELKPWMRHCPARVPPKAGTEKAHPGLSLPPMLPGLPPAPPIGQTQPQTWEPEKGRPWDEPSPPPPIQSKKGKERWIGGQKGPGLIEEQGLFIHKCQECESKKKTFLAEERGRSKRLKKRRNGVK